MIFLKEGIQVAETKVAISNEKQPLAAGETKKFQVPLSAAATRADTLRLNLQRHSESRAGRPPIILSATIIDSISEAFH